MGYDHQIPRVQGRGFDVYDDLAAPGDWDGEICGEVEVLEERGVVPGDWGGGGDVDRGVGFTGHCGGGCVGRLMRYAFEAGESFSEDV